jgi:hypothetical protein
MYFLVPLVNNRQARNGRAQRSYPLLPVDEDLLVRRDQAALERCTKGRWSSGTLGRITFGGESRAAK